MNKGELRTKAIITFIVIALIFILVYILMESLTFTSTNVNSNVVEKHGEETDSNEKDDGSIKTTGVFVRKNCNGTYYGTMKKTNSNNKLVEERKLTLILFNSYGKDSGKSYYTDTIGTYEGNFSTSQNNKLFVTLNKDKLEFVASDDCDKLARKEEDVENNLTINYRLKRLD
jgi:hypothetical protein